MVGMMACCLSQLTMRFGQNQAGFFSATHRLVSPRQQVQRETKNRKKREKTHITQMHIPPGATTPRAALVRRAPRAARVRILAARPAPQRRAAGARKRLRRRPQVLVAGRVGREDLVQERQEPPALAKRARRGRELRRRPDGELGHGRVRLQVGQEERGRRGEWVGENFLGEQNIKDFPF